MAVLQLRRQLGDVGEHLRRAEAVPRIDDERDSLAHKLVRLLERELADVSVHDPRVTTPTPPFEETVAGADAIVVAANHDEFRGPEPLLEIAASPQLQNGHIAL